MTHEEKRAWIRLAISVLAYGVYVVLVVRRTDGRDLQEVPYAAAMLWTIGAAIVAAIVTEIVISILNPSASRLTDERDREIGRLGDHVGQAFLVIGALAAMLMAMADWHRFWIANVIYLGFVLAAVLGDVAKVIVYRRSLPQW